jgi:hypothetical protein
VCLVSGESQKEGTYPSQSPWSLNVVHIVPHLNMKSVTSVPEDRVSLDERNLPLQYNCLVHNSLSVAAINPSDSGHICNGSFGAVFLNRLRSPWGLFLVEERTSLVDTRFRGY